MSARKFRRSNRRNRRFFFLVALLFVLGLVRCHYSSHSSINPADLSLASGEYQLLSVSDAGLIQVAMPTEVPSKRRVDSLRIKLLGVQVQLRGEAVDALRRLTHDVDTVRLRFDRRRVTDDTRELQAYVYIDEICLNEELARLGLAEADTHPSDAGPMIRRIKKAEQDARELRRGAWQ